MTNLLKGEINKYKTFLHIFDKMTDIKIKMSKTFNMLT